MRDKDGRGYKMVLTTNFWNHLDRWNSNSRSSEKSTESLSESDRDALWQCGHW